MKKICLVIHSLQAGGTERVMSELAAHFAGKEGVEVHLIVYGRSRDIFYDIPEAVELHTPDFAFDNTRRFRSTLKTLRFLRKKIKTLNPDSILSLGEYWNSFVLLSLSGLNYPVYISDRCKPDKNLGRVHEKLRSFLYPKAAGVVAQTKYAKKLYLERGLSRNIEVIGNPIREIQSENGVSARENVILTVGRLIETKHHDRLMRIFKEIHREDWKLIIVGGNAIKQDGMGRLQKLREELGLSERVILTGTASNVEEYYRMSKIFAFTSSSEGFPNVVGEAMAAGLPVVSYNCKAGPSEMISHEESGYLVDLFDDREFGKRLTQLMEEEALRRRMGEHSEKRIKLFSRKRIGEKYYHFITGNRDLRSDSLVDENNFEEKVNN